VLVLHERMYSNVTMSSVFFVSQLSSPLEDIMLKLDAEFLGHIL
jgi:hypothetical protein